MDTIIRIFLCGCNYLIWSLPLFCILVILYKIKPLPSFIFRKLLHITAFTGIIFMNLRQQSWQDAIVCLGIGAIASYCILSIMEKKDFFQEFFEEKFPHEVKRNLSGVFLTIAALEEFLAITIGEPMLVNVVIIVWGFGDAAAALVGIPFGKHKLPIADKKKSIEGSVAFVLVSTVLTSMFMAIAMPGMEFIVPNIVAILLAAIVGSIVEVIAKDKWDNLIVPVAITVIFLFLKM